MPFLTSLPIGSRPRSPAFFATWGWPLFYGAMAGVLVVMAILPFPHQSAVLHIGANGCALLRAEGFRAEPRAEGCLVRGGYRDVDPPGFISLRQGEREILVHSGMITAITREPR